MSEYFIKDGYIPNSVCETFEDRSGRKYWTTKRIFASRIYQYPVYQYVNKLIKTFRIGTLVDLGCGPGSKLLPIHKKNPGLTIVGVDQESAISYCKESYDFGEWFADDFERPSTALTEYIDKRKLILSCDVIEHLVNPDLLLEYIKSLANTDDIIVLSTPERDNIRGVNCLYSPNIQHIREWNSEEFINYVQSHGFKVMETKIVYPIKIGLNRIFIRDILKRLHRKRKFKYCQILLVKKV